MEDGADEGLISFFDDYLKKIIAQDMSCIYGEEVRLLDDNPLVFQVDKR